MMVTESNKQDTALAVWLYFLIKLNDIDKNEHNKIQFSHAFDKRVQH